MRLSFFSFLFFLSISLFGQQFSERKIRRIIKKIPQFEKVHIAVSVVALNEAKPKASYQDKHYMTPASNTKLLTFLAAVQRFDSLPALYYREQDSLLHFKATGYPLLFHPYYPDSTLAAFFEQKKIWKYHPSASKMKPQGPGWSWDDYSYYYAAERSPFPIFGNVVQVFGSASDLKFLPQAFEKELLVDSLGANLKRDKFKNQFRYNPETWKTQDTLYKPFITSDTLFARLLEQQIRQPVKMEEQPLELAWEVLYTHQEELLYKALLQDSDNGIAEALLAMISQSHFEKMDVKKTIDTLQNQWSTWLPDPLEWVDGSGISRYNMVTPRTLIAVLKKIHQRVGWQKIQTYFPKSGISGTLTAYPNLKNIYAKTGTLRHNHNLSGYWESPKGNKYAFSIMVNHYTTPTQGIREGISKLLHLFQKKLN